MGIGKKLRFEIFKRDEFRCQYCGRSSESKEVTLEVDHVIAKAQGGSDLPENLLTACFDCNRGKSKNGLGHTLILKRDLKKEKAALRKAKKIMEHDAKMKAEMEAQVEELHWGIGHMWGHELEEEFKASLKYFLKKIGRAEILDAMEITAYKDVSLENTMTTTQMVKYFCGVCHNKARDKENG